MGCSASTAAAIHIPQDELKLPCKESLVADFHTQYVLGEKLGKGAFAQVHSAKKVNETVSKAVKIMDTSSSDSEDRLRIEKSVLNEVCVWKTVGRHANCVELYEVFHDADLCYMVMEKCQRSLYDHLDNLPELHEHTLGQVFSQMLSGIAHLHSMNVVHRDIKPDNFLCGSDGCTIKLADYGLSVSLTGNKKCSGVYGTAPFMCPEMLSGFQYDAKADMWSFAVTMYVLLFGRFPYEPEEETSRGMKRAILKGRTIQFKQAGINKQSISDRGIEFVRSLLNRNPAERPSAMEALDSQYMVAMLESSDLRMDGHLPSLRPMFYSAVKSGAFIDCNLSRKTALDRSLNSLQLKARGKESLSKARDKESLCSLNSLSSVPPGCVSPPSLESASTVCGSSESPSTGSDGSSHPTRRGAGQLMKL